MGTLAGAGAVFFTAAIAAGRPLLDAAYHAVAIGSSPQAVAVGDLNGDDRPDVVTMGRTGTVLLGTFDGGLQRLDYAASAGTNLVTGAIALGDLNGDGRLDAVVVGTDSTSGHTTIQGLLGAGDGTLAAQLGVVAPAPSPVVAVALGDLNGDGRLDVATVGDQRNAISILLGNGDGTFGAVQDVATVTQPTGIAVVDVNRDGHLDLVAVGGSMVWVALGNGNGSFGTPQSYPAATEPWAIAAADLDGDGRPDLAVANRADQSVSLFLGTAAGTFQPRTDLPVGGNPVSIAIADVNGDGRLDIATGSATVASALLGQGGGAFAAHRDFSSPGSAIAVADLDGDRVPDLALAGGCSLNGGSSVLAIVHGHGNGDFGTHRSFSIGGDPTVVALADLNGDHRLDVVTDNYDIGAVDVLLGGGDGTFGPERDWGAYGCPFSIALGDVNGDGKLDMAVGNGCSTEEMPVRLGNGDGTFGDATVYPTDVNMMFVAMGDLNGDGKLDLVTASTNYGSVLVMLGNGDGTFQQSYTATSTCPWGIALPDLNHDGKPDLVMIDACGNAAVVMLGVGDGTFGPSHSYPTGIDPKGLAVADLDGDGNPDLAIANRGSNTVTVLRGNGFGSFHAPQTIATGRGPISIAAGDIDGDGKPDLVVADFDDCGPYVSVLLGHGDGTFAARDDYGVDAAPRSVAIGDLDGDGHADVVVACDYPSNAVVPLMHFTPTTAVPRPLANEPGVALRVSPSPSRGATHVEFTVPQEQRVRVSVVDVQGRLRAVLADGVYAAGRHRVDWNSEGGAPAGVYFVRYEQAGRPTARRLVIIR